MADNWNTPMDDENELQNETLKDILLAAAEEGEESIFHTYKPQEEIGAKIFTELHKRYKERRAVLRWRITTV